MFNFLHWLCERRERRKSLKRLQELIKTWQLPDSALRVEKGKLIFTNEDGEEYELESSSEK